MDETVSFNLDKYLYRLEELEQQREAELQTASDLLSSFDCLGDRGEQGWDAQEKSAALGRFNRAQTLLRKVQAVLRWMDTHPEKVGQCAACDTDIRERLSVIPDTIYCCEHSANTVP